MIQPGFHSSYQRWNIHLSGNYLQFPVHISGSPSVASVPEDEMGGWTNRFLA